MDFVEKLHHAIEDLKADLKKEPDEASITKEESPEPEDQGQALTIPDDGESLARAEGEGWPGFLQED